MDVRAFCRPQRLLPWLVAFAFACNECCSFEPSAAATPIARVHHSVRTTSSRAQAEFDEGLTLMYAFNPEEALAHFQAAGSLDPSMAMAFWGIALSAGPNVNTPYDLTRAAVGRAASREASALATRGPDVERRLTAALELRYRVDVPAQILAAETAYADAMRGVSRRYPNDVDVATLSAESLMDLTPLAMWTHDGRPTRYTNEVIGILDRVLARAPAHLGANHLYIHVFEHAPDPGKALPSARRLAALTFEPAAEHLAHMPAHIFMREGSYAEAIATSRAAVALFEALIRSESSHIHDGYYHHDLQVLNWAYQMSGQWTQAEKTATQIAAQVNDSEAAVETYERFGKWHELLTLAAPDRPGPRWHLARGLADAHTGDSRGAAEELRYLRGLHDDDGRLKIACDLLDARVRKDIAGSLADYRDAVAREDALDLQEPPRWYYPIRESLGGAYLRARRYREAAATFAGDVRRNPNNGRSLFGIALAMEHLDPARVSDAQRAFHAAWRLADTRLNADDL